MTVLVMSHLGKKTGVSGCCDVNLGRSSPRPLTTRRLPQTPDATTPVKPVATNSSVRGVLFEAAEAGECLATFLRCQTNMEKSHERK